MSLSFAWFRRLTYRSQVGRHGHGTTRQHAAEHLRPRALRLEALEIRTLMTADGISSLDSSIPEYDAPLADFAVADDWIENGGTLDYSGAGSGTGPEGETGGAPESQTLLGEEEESVGANQPPVITELCVEVAALGGWIVSGTVADPDDDVTGWTVDFSGVLDGYSAQVLADGSFTLISDFPELVDGDAFALTVDPHGAESNMPSYYVDV